MKKIIYLTVLSVCILNFTTKSLYAGNTDLKPEEVLELYEQSLKPMNGTVAYKGHLETAFEGAREPQDERIKEVSFVYRDGSSLFLDEQRIISSENNNKTNIYKSKYVLNEKHAMIYNPPEKEGDAGRLYIDTDVDEKRKSIHNSLGTSSVFDGYLSGCNDLTIPEVLHGAASLNLQDSMEVIDGHSTYVLEADTKYGKHTLWIDPNAGYNPRQIIVEKSIGDLDYNLPLGTPPPPLQSLVSWATPYLAVIKKQTKIYSIKIENISGIYIPVSGVKESYEEFEDGQAVKTTTVFKRESIDFNPDFQALGGFTIDTPNGTSVYCDDSPGVKYIWQNGKIVNEDDGTVRPMPQRKKLLVSLGEPLPEFENLTLSEKPISDKQVLICFFDIEQRPSRNCILEISKKAKKLKEKGVEIIAIQTSKIEQAKLDEWNKENDITFSVGMVQDNEEEAKLNWGVKSLPWLILTDKEHIVSAEGFSINELGEKIETLNK